MYNYVLIIYVSQKMQVHQIRVKIKLRTRRSSHATDIEILMNLNETLNIFSYIIIKENICRKLAECTCKLM